MEIKTHDTYAEILLKEPKYHILVVAVHRNIANLFHTDPPKFFPEYTIHGVDHIENLFKLSLELIDKTTLDKLTPRDTAVLVLSMSLHDIGMFVTPDGLQKILFSSVKNKSLSDKWDAYVKEIKGYGDDKIKKIFGFDNKITEHPREISKRQPDDILMYGEFIRRHHHELSREIINGFFPGDIDFDIFSGTDYAFDSKTRESDYKRFRGVIGIIAESHGIPIRNTEESLKKLVGDSAYKNPLKIPVFFIMAVLRLADLLDAGEHRAPEVLQNSIGIKSLISKEEWTWNQRINIENYDFVTEHGYLHIDADPQSGMEYIKIAEWLKYIQSELDLSWAVISEYYIIGQFNLTVHRIKSIIFDEKSRKSYDDKFVTERATFKVMPDLLKLLIQPLYDDNPTFGVRELLQNAVDACNEREALGNYPLGEEGKITVCVDTKAKTFTIEDNGIGMTKDVILNHYLSIGSSYRFSEDYLNKYMENGKSIVSRSGRFGIGVLAMFLIGKKATVTTQSYDEELGYKFILELEQENIEIKRDKYGIGTKIVVDFNNDANEFFHRPATENLYSDQSWINWYWLKTPKIEYIVDDRVVSNPKDVFETDTKSVWYNLLSENYKNYRWTYGLSLTDIMIPEFMLCNGFVINRKHDENNFFRGFGWTIQYPIISLSDPSNEVRLNLSRTDFVELPDAKILVKEVFKFIIARLLRQDFTSTENHNNNIKHGFTYTCSNYRYDKYDINYEFKSPSYKYLIFKSGYTILSSAFLYCANIDRINVYYAENHNVNNIDITTIESHVPFYLDYSLKREKNTFIKSLVNGEVIRTYLFHRGDLNTTYSEDKNDYYNFNLTLNNIVTTKKNMNILLDELDALNRKSKKVSPNMWMLNFIEEYEFHSQIRLNDLIPIMADYSISVTPKNENNLIVNTLHEYLGDDIWIPFDMEERKKKFPKAFKELAMYM